MLADRVYGKKFGIKWTLAGSATNRSRDYVGDWYVWGTVIGRFRI